MAPVEPGWPQPVDSLAALLGEHDAILCDIWGTIHDGRAAIPGAVPAMRAARARGVPVVLTSNVPRPGSALLAPLARVGIPRDAWDALVTSGDLVREELARRAPGPALRLGRTTDTSLWEGTGVAFAGVADAQFAVIAGLRDALEEPGSYRDVLTRARIRDLELVCANPDVQVMHGSSLQWCAGSVAAQYEALGGRVVQAGKPHPPIYQRARAVVADLLGRPADRLLAVGDGIPTDVIGADREGIDCLFVATGINGDTLLGPDGRPDAGQVHAALAARGTRAAWVIDRLR